MTRQRVFITGGASGLGKAIALFYAKKNAKVAIGDINTEALESTQKELSQYTDEVLTFECNTRDINSLAHVRETIETQWQGLDLLVNNAGVAGTHGDIETVDLGDWDTVLDINVMGVVRGCKEFASLFKKQSSGAIVNIASMAGIINPPGASAYNASKAAVISISESVKFEMLPYNVTVHAVCPAFFKTNLTASMKSSEKAKAFVDREMEKSDITAEDIAAMIDQQIQSNQFLLLTHKKERRLWQLKRFIPAMYERMTNKAFLKILQRTAKR